MKKRKRGLVRRILPRGAQVIMITGSKCLWTIHHQLPLREIFTICLWLRGSNWLHIDASRRISPHREKRMKVELERSSQSRKGGKLESLRPLKENAWSLQQRPYKVQITTRTRSVQGKSLRSLMKIKWVYSHHRGL